MWRSNTFRRRPELASCCIPYLPPEILKMRRNILVARHVLFHGRFPCCAVLTALWIPSFEKGTTVARNGLSATRPFSSPKSTLSKSTLRGILAPLRGLHLFCAIPLNFAILSLGITSPCPHRCTPWPVSHLPPLLTLALPPSGLSLGLWPGYIYQQTMFIFFVETAQLGDI